ncbi:hypothetical protein PF002_g20718 [Phytophthora fragariae]|uniref:DDE Tnp4 domain-containing protein n=1 Tax=Phytophthora fragariae TaxID=53985 RepID=A0A6A3XVP3_9STRA|nr:hypothetical protein PF002_g20718 [Phytophthora fragariae]
MLKKRRHLRKIIRYVTCACILHNILIAEPVPKQCDDEIRANGSSSGDLDKDDELDLKVANADGEARRNQLPVYLLEVRGWQVSVDKAESRLDLGEM